MKFNQTFTGWSNLEIEDLLLAYRKAKADCFYDNNFPNAVKFSEYEGELLQNINKLLEDLKRNGLESFGSNFKYRILPKRLGQEDKNTNSNEKSYSFYSSAEKAFKCLLHEKKLKPEFKIVGDFDVEDHIISALWINLIGHKYDALLSKNSYAFRLKRIYSKEIKESKREYHLRSINSFEPYIYPYQRWRNNGIKAVKEELKKDNDVLLAALDIKSFYNSIEIKQITAFLNRNTFIDETKLDLSEEEKKFNEEYVEYLQNWESDAKDYIYNHFGFDAKSLNVGLPVGITSSRIISNLVLLHFDEAIEKNLAPIYYGRYVDDIFLLLKDSGQIDCNNNLLKYLTNKFSSANLAKGESNSSLVEVENKENDTFIKLYANRDSVRLNSEKQKDECISITFQEKKQRSYFLSGKSGLDLIDNLEHELREFSSEHRLLPDVDNLENSTAARVLSTGNMNGSSANNIRTTDNLTIKKLSWALKLRQFEIIAQDLPPKQWEKSRNEFYDFAYNHVIRPDKIFDYFNYIPKLFGFAISIDDWKHANLIYSKTIGSLDKLKNSISDGKDQSKTDFKFLGDNYQESISVLNQFFDEIKKSILCYFYDATVRYCRVWTFLNDNKKKNKELLSYKLLNEIYLKIYPSKVFSIDELTKAAWKVAVSDLSQVPYKYINSNIDLSFCNQENIDGYIKLFSHQDRLGEDLLKILAKKELLDEDVVKDVVGRIFSNIDDSTNSKISKYYYPFIFPTRPLLTSEISELVPSCLGLIENSGVSKENSFPLAKFARYVKTIRGSWIKHTLDALESFEQNKNSSNSDNVIQIGNEKLKSVKIGVTNIKTEETDWELSASKKPNHSKNRYSLIVKVVNDAIKSIPKPDFVVFPELSIPLRWLKRINYALHKSKISLICGTEYKHYNDNKICSHAFMSLNHDGLGFPGYVNIWQAKNQPAVKEGEELAKKYGKSWSKTNFDPIKGHPVYCNNDFYFGVLICSEFQNTKARLSYQGNIDALFVISWNKDLQTFSSLVEGAALDLHAYLVLVNNREYGDSRIRVAAKEDHRRDLVKIRGGDNDFVVVSQIDIDSLKKFHSRANRYLTKTDMFKPRPEDFVISKGRKRMPPI